MTNLRFELLRQVSNICDEFEAILVAGKTPIIEDWLDLVSDIARDELFYELLRLELAYQPISAESARLSQLGRYLKRFPENSSAVVKAFAQLRAAENEKCCDFGESSPEVDVPPLEPGDTIGSYRLNSILGSGGFSTVFAATDLKSQKHVAIKSLRRKVNSNHTKRLESFVLEAAALSKLDHKSIPKIYAIGEDSLGDPYVVMEFVKGESLQSIIEGKRLSLESLLLLLAKTAEALGYIHESGFYHRDLKPANIVVGFDGEPRIVDFGLAIHESRQSVCDDQRVGTRAFMSPEQMLGDCGKLDGRTDIWSLGVILYFIVAGRLPFRVDSSVQESVDEVFERPVKPPRQIRGNCATVALETICFRALEKNPKHRYSTAYDFANDLRSAVDGLAEDLLLEDSGLDETLSHNDLTLIMLARHAKVWNEQPDVGHLPGFLRYARFRFYSSRELWSEAESHMMRAAGRRLAFIAGFIAIAVGVIGFFVLQAVNQNHQTKLQSLIDEIGAAELCDNADLVAELHEIGGTMSQRLLHQAFLKSQSEDDIEKQIRFGLSRRSRYPELEPLIERRLIESRLDEVDALSRAGSPRQLRSLRNWQKSRLRQVISSSPAAVGSHVLWPAPGGFAYSEIINSGGLMTTDWAYCGRMPIKTFRRLCARLRHSKYRPVCIRPYVRKGRTYVAAIWNRDAIGWEVDYGLSLSQLATELKRRKSNGLYLVDASDGLISPTTGANTYVAIWSKQNNQVAKARRLAVEQELLGVAENKRSSNDFVDVKRDFQTDLLANVPGIIDVRFERSAGNCNSVAILKQRNRLSKIMSGKTETSSQLSKLLNQASVVSDVFARKNQLDAIEKFGSRIIENVAMETSPLGSSISKLFDSGLEHLRSSNRSLAVTQLLMDGEVCDEPLEKILVAESCLELAHGSEEQFFSADEVERLENRAAALYRSAIEADGELNRWLLYTKNLWRESENVTFQSLLKGTSRELISGVWAKEHSSFQTKFVSPQSIVSHRQQAFANGEAGWRPVSISSVIIDGQQSFASVWHRPVWTSADDQRLQETVNAICFGWKHGFDLGVAAALSNQSNPAMRNRMIQTLIEFKVSGDSLVDLLGVSTNKSSRYGLLVVLARLPESSFSKSANRQLQKLLTRFTKGKDAGIRMAAKWTSSRRGPPEDPRPLVQQTSRHLSSRDWIEHHDGQTLIEIPQTADADRKTSRRKKKVIFLVGAKPVCSNTYLQFDPTAKLNNEKGCDSAHVTFSQAAAFCNWMSQQDGIDQDQWCYCEDENGVLHEKSDLEKLSGYRLPYSNQLAIAATERENRLWLTTAPSDSRQAKQIERRIAEQPNINGFFGLASGDREWVNSDPRLPATDQPHVLTSDLIKLKQPTTVATVAPFRICRPKTRQRRSTLASKHHPR